MISQSVDTLVETFGCSMIFQSVATLVETLLA